MRVLRRQIEEAIISRLTGQSVGSLVWKIVAMMLLAGLPVVAQEQAPANTAQGPAADVAQQQASADVAQQTAPANTEQQTPQSGPPSNPEKPEQKKSAEERAQTNPQSGTSSDRLFYTLPNFLTVQNTQLPPLTPAQKFKVVARGSFDYVEYFWYGALAGISQAENSEAGYGQGAAGYGQRYGAAIADGTIENFMTAAVLPSLLRQDPRYYELGKGSFWHRTGYAISRIFITPTDSGHMQFNFSEIVGSAMSAGISTYSYHPRGDRNLRNTASVWGTQIGYDTVTLVVKEFWPDIRRRIARKRQKETTGTD